MHCSRSLSMVGAGGAETSRVTEFGWGTWWLTGETAIVKLTRDIVRQNKGRYIMRPGFLLNFLTLAPSAVGRAASIRYGISEHARHQAARAACQHRPSTRSWTR